MLYTKSQTSYEALLWLIACKCLIGNFRSEVNAPYGQSYSELQNRAGYCDESYCRYALASLSRYRVKRTGLSGALVDLWVMRTIADVLRA